jgi:hypothetical protein
LEVLCAAAVDATAVVTMKMMLNVPLRESLASAIWVPLRVVLVEIKV